MKLTDLFKKRSFKSLTKDINDSNSKRIKKGETKNIVEDTLRQIEEHVEVSNKDKQQTYTFIRLETLEAFATWATTSILQNQNDILIINSSNKAEFKKIWDKINDIKPSTQADNVLDTTDNAYKNVKDIIINKAINANMLYDDIEKRYKPMSQIKVESTLNADFAKQADNAKEAAVAIKVKCDSGIQDIETILMNYIPKSIMRDVLLISPTYQHFKDNLNSVLSTSIRKGA